MTDNVIILGAGFSCDSGIPLLGGVVERMLEYALRRKANGVDLSPQDVEIFASAIKVRNELDGYHGRASFDDRNIEDILSILSFNALSGGKKERTKLESITRALARTIELSCSVKHPGVNKSGSNKVIKDGPEQYRDFWLSLFRWKGKGHSLPTIITFNYDLVLERSLLQVLISNSNFNFYDNHAPFSSIRVSYFSDQVLNPAFQLKSAIYGEFEEQRPGTILVPIGGNPPQDTLDIEILKLHGSLNFPEKPVKESNGDFNIAASVDTPYILPPIFNKLSSSASVIVWKTAIQRLREAKNIVVVGYSLPRTDVYMQYFLKASLGPNLDLNRITVFDPELFREGKCGKDLKERYEECFAAQLQGRIVFQPQSKNAPFFKNLLGTTAHFVNVLEHEPNSILF